MSVSRQRVVNLVFSATLPHQAFENFEWSSREVKMVLTSQQWEIEMWWDEVSRLVNRILKKSINETMKAADQKNMVELEIHQFSAADAKKRKEIIPDTFFHFQFDLSFFLWVFRYHVKLLCSNIISRTYTPISFYAFDSMQFQLEKTPCDVWTGNFEQNKTFVYLFISNHAAHVYS